ncbi:heterogeneous nuclear ribonucleoprotein A2 homolog 2-like isoform X3 [Papaver somniferum]|uniref:heterogeneous nuclear ribonucleoprotein A2 homolog 2-like isoform X3 n=1 Tax=Papaver somniferum TaxID=3469 RepID=UPI000E6FFC1B|nr:heterogeneous nuclear ribonucleoprotein A2 homolog 2-like isoform X3 [Papaver somniferum]
MGFGFITFNSEEAVENVMQKRFHELNDKVVEVKRAVPKDVSNNGHNGGYNMRINGERGGSLFLGGEGACRPNRGAVKGSMASKPKKLALSDGSASGKGHAKRNTPVYRPVSATKPLKLDIKDLPIDELIDEDVSSDSTAKGVQTHTGELWRKLF